MQELVQQTFEFDTPEIAERVITLYSEIKDLELINQRIEFEKGKRFAAIRNELRHNKRGGFEAWLEFESIANGTAYNLIKVYEVFGNSPTVGELLPAKVLYLLASPSTPEPARLEAINRAEQGETITYTKAKEIVEQHKTPSLPRQVAWQKWGDAITEEYGPGYGPDNFPIGYDPEVLAHSSPAPQSQPMALLASSKNDSWRTPAKYIGAAREVMGGIDLDPASSEEANEIISATYYYTKEDDGLTQPWEGRVWLNPPYGKTRNMSNQGLFADKLSSEFEAGNVTEGILLVNLYWSYDWFKPLRNKPLCIPDDRITFINPDTGEEGDEAKATSVFIYFGKNPEKFYQVFSKFGYCGQLFKR